jgi:hypothetical protein
MVGGGMFFAQSAPILLEGRFIRFVFIYPKNGCFLGGKGGFNLSFWLFLGAEAGGNPNRVVIKGSLLFGVYPQICPNGHFSLS